MNIQDLFIEELVERVKGEEGKFYIVNTLIIPKDENRIIGPLGSMDEVKKNKSNYDRTVKRYLSPEEITKHSFALYQYNNGSFEPVELTEEDPYAEHQWRILR